MNRICFSHDYPKLHGQTTAQLLAVKPLTVDRNTDADLLEYDTHFYQPRGGVGHYILKPGKYLRLIFDGNKGIPFTTIRKAYPPQKTEYYLGKIGETFEVWVISDKRGRGMTDTKKETTPTFGLIGLNWEFKIKPTDYPVLEIHASAFWFRDTMPTADAKLLAEKTTETIKQCFVCNGGDCERHRLGAEPCAHCPFCDEEGNI